MIRSSRLGSLYSLGTALLAFAAQACVIDLDHGRRRGDVVLFDDEGLLTIEWDVDGTTDWRACDDFDADYIAITIYDWRGRVETDLEVRCDDFEASIELPDGEYGLDATLIDYRDRPVSTTLSLDDIDVYEGDETVVPIDFPADSQL